MSRTLVLGATTNPSRYAYKAVELLQEKNQEIVLLGNKKGSVKGIEIQNDYNQIENIETVTVYLGAKNQEPYYTFLENLKPTRVIFNPGAENQELKEILTKQGISVIEACTLVMLSTNQY